MPELPDIELYRVRLAERLVGATLESVTIANPFVVRSVSPEPHEFVGKSILGIERLGKRLVLVFPEETFVVLHLMIAGRLQWSAPAPQAKKPAGKIQLAVFRFSSGQLVLTEVSTRKRASVHFVRGRTALLALGRGGADVRSLSHEDFAQRLKSRNRTLKRALTDPAEFDGIGNAFSDEILFRARLSPVRLTSSLTQEETLRLHDACASTLTDWTERLQAEIVSFPKPAQVTAFRPDYAAHGRYGLPCPVCGRPIQRIVYAENETNYCAFCQNEGRLLADRSLSRLLKSDWPKTLEEMVGS